MTTDHDVDRITTTFLRDGPAELADRVLDDALAEIHVTRQRRRLPAPWRNRPMSSFSLRLAAVIAVIAVGGFALFELGRGPTIAAPATPFPATPLPTAPASLTAVASVPPTAAATPVAPTPTAPAALLAPLGYVGGGTIAFTRDDPAVGGSAPFLVDPSGKNEARIVIQHGWGSAPSVPGTGCCGVFSPDGSKLAVGYEEVNPSRGPGTHAATQIVTRYGFSLSLIPMVCGACAMIEGVDFVPRAWSAAEHGLLALDFTSTADPTRAGVGLAPMDGLPTSVGWQTQVTGQPDDRALAFSPDGSRLLFVRPTTDKGGELWVMTLATKKVQRLSQVGEVVSADTYLSPGASWSPDGTRVAYAATDASGSTANMRVFVVDAAGGAAKPITSASSYSTTAAWSPDGAWIAYDVDMGGLHHVFVVRPDGSGARDLMSDASFGACCAHWSPDGSALVAPATASGDDQSDLVVLPLDGSGIRQVTSTPAFYTSISWGAASR